MAKYQIPADVHSLVQLLARLDIIVGPMKAAQVKDDRISIWFVTTRGVAPIKRVKARLVRGDESGPGSHRRVYLDLQIQEITGFQMGQPVWNWRSITDDEYREAGLQKPSEYKGDE